MKDTLETNLTGENTVELNETKEQVAAATPQAAEVATETNEAEVESAGKLTKDEILSRLKSLVEAPVENVRSEVESLKQAYYKIRHNEVEAQKNAFLSQGGAEEDFAIPEDTSEAELKDLLAIYKEKKAALLAEEEKQKEANYTLKLQLIDQLKALCASQEDFNKLYNEFKAIQQKWKEIKQVPEEHANELWHEYQTYSEQFYDLIKINNQFRDYDFKKNLELKTALCETVEKLENEPDVISAFHQLQKLHQQYFENMKAKEQDNLVAKTAICGQVEAIDYTKLKTFKDWDKKNTEVIELQKRWRTIGFTPKKYNTKIFERFRSACDVFFKKKIEFYKTMKAEMEKNLEKKRQLCELAEAMKDSTDWKETTDKFVELQKEWKAVGQVQFRHSDAIWKRFITACDYFFEQKEKAFASQKSEEQENLKAKKELIEKVKSLDESLDPDETGVPYRLRGVSLNVSIPNPLRSVAAVL